MNELLQQAFDRLAELPEAQQRAIATQILQKLDRLQSTPTITLDVALKDRVGRLSFEPADLSERTREAFGRTQPCSDRNKEVI
ncbi:hypothetical protein [Baaleninema simplex]|uniref:hypothetical protein n=1 Tax=Baaleninema simplex TaxID=2862350 RepID=UPI0003455D03|nr:hypothetical protein [Baaleninema simplex]